MKNTTQFIQIIGIDRHSPVGKLARKIIRALSDYERRRRSIVNRVA